jgi:hypothetical protein
MSIFAEIIQRDLAKGLEAEDKTLPFIRKHFGENIFPTKDVFGEYYGYDFYDICSNIVVELKTRFDGVPLRKYPTSTIGFNKVKFAIENPEKDCYIIVKYTDGFWCVKVDNDIINLKPSWFKKKNGELKYNVHIPVSKFYRLD